MDRITLEAVVKREAADYSGPAHRATTYFLEDARQSTYTVVIIPDNDYPVEAHPGIMVMARIVDERVVVEVDITDKPLYQELMRCGVPREQIVLRYMGEHMPDSEAEKPA